jgi:hypothetical protein
MILWRTSGFGSKSLIRWVPKVHKIWNLESRLWVSQVLPKTKSRIELDPTAVTLHTRYPPNIGINFASY